MKINESNVSNMIEDVHVSKYGNFYFLKGFIVSEINEDVLYNWEAAQDVIEAAIKHYGENPSICYVSNRVNNYSVNAIDWFKFFTSEKNLNGYAIVSYSKKGWMNALIEKLFFSSKIEQFDNLEDAIIWAEKVNSEFKTKKTKSDNHFDF